MWLLIESPASRLRDIAGKPGLHSAYRRIEKVVVWLCRGHHLNRAVLQRPCCRSVLGISQIKWGFDGVITWMWYGKPCVCLPCAPSSALAEDRSRHWRLSMAWFLATPSAFTKMKGMRNPSAIFGVHVWRARTHIQQLQLPRDGMW
jgi:hypothetical protein